MSKVKKKYVDVSVADELLARLKREQSAAIAM